MSIKRFVSAATATAAAAGVLALAPTGSAEAALRIRCVPIFVDWDSDDVEWICEIVWD